MRASRKGQTSQTPVTMRLHIARLWPANSLAQGCAEIEAAILAGEVAFGPEAEIGTVCITRIEDIGRLAAQGKVLVQLIVHAQVEYVVTVIFHRVRSVHPVGVHMHP